MFWNLGVSKQFSILFTTHSRNLGFIFHHVFFLIYLVILLIFFFFFYECSNISTTWSHKWGCTIPILKLQWICWTSPIKVNSWFHALAFGKSLFKVKFHHLHKSIGSFTDVTLQRAAQEFITAWTLPLLQVCRLCMNTWISPPTPPLLKRSAHTLEKENDKQKKEKKHGHWFWEDTVRSYTVIHTSKVLQRTWNKKCHETPGEKL